MSGCCLRGSVLFLFIYFSYARPRHGSYVTASSQNFDLQRQDFDLHRLRRLERILNVEEAAVTYLHRYTRRHAKTNHWSLALENDFLDTNSSDRKSWLNKNKAEIVRDCDIDAYEMTKADPGGFCEVAKTDCKSEGTLNYLVLPYCILPNYTWMAVLIMIAWLMILVLWLSTTVDYICPNLVMVTHVLGIRDSVAGITFLGPRRIPPSKREQT